MFANIQGCKSKFYKRHKSSISSRKGQTCINKASQPQTVTLGWHFLQWTAYLSVHFMLPSLGEVLCFHMKCCTQPLDQMKAIVGWALWCLCDAYLLFQWKYCVHGNMFSSGGRATAKPVLNSKKALLYHGNWFLNVTVFSNVMLMKYNELCSCFCLL